MEYKEFLELKAKIVADKTELVSFADKFRRLREAHEALGAKPTLTTLRQFVETVASLLTNGGV